MKKQNKGITLVALVITIIVLIILAGVSINAVMNDGLITNAKDAKNEYTQGKDKEKKILSQLKIEEMEMEFLKKGIPYKYKKQYITGISIGTTIKEMLDKFPQNEGYAIYNSDATEQKNNTDVLETGLVLKKGEEVVGRIIIFGELANLEEHVIDSEDALLLLKWLRNNNMDQLTEYKLVAADVNHDGIVNFTDADLISNHFAKRENINQNEYAIREEDLVFEDAKYEIENYMNSLSKKFRNSKYYFEWDDEGYYLLKQKSAETITVSELLNLLPEGSKIRRGNQIYDNTSNENIVYEDEIIIDFCNSNLSIGYIDF